MIKVIELDRHGIKLISGDKTMTVSGIDTTSRFVRELAPRQNTGVQPVGDDVVVDLKFKDGHSELECKAACYAWNVNRDYGFSEIISWKPCMKWLTEQSNIKTEEEIQEMGKVVFTQEMADANIKPLAGMEVIVINCGNNNGEALVKFCSDDYLIVDHPSDCGSEQYYHMSSVEIKPIPTARDKAINMIAHEIDINHGMTFRQIAAVIYDAELLKEVK